MSQIAEMESQVDIKSSAERFYNTYCNKQNLFSKMSPNIVKDVQLIKGDHAKSVGSVMKWTYDGAGTSSQTMLALTEAIDEKNNSVTYRAIDGDVMKLFSLYKCTVQVKNKPDENGASVKLIIQYEKQNDDVPDPKMYSDVGAVFFKDIDAYLINNP